MKFSLSKDKTSYRVDIKYPNGTRQRFYPGTSEVRIAERICRRMELDELEGSFDATLDKYRVKPPKVEIPKQDNSKLLTLWDRWVSSLHLPLHVKNNHYHWVRVMIAKVDPNWNDVSWFQNLTLSPCTWNQRRGYLKRCVEYAINQGWVNGRNEFTVIKPKKAQTSRVKPFTHHEVKRILEYFQNNRYDIYTPYLKFSFLTACRPCEVIGLEWRHVHWHEGVIEISESVVRDLATSPTLSKNIKVRKPTTKTGAVKYIPITPDILSVLEMCTISEYTQLLFPGPNNEILPETSFYNAWGRVLAQLDIAYRNPYQTRHTALSNVASKHGLVAAAKVAGHKDLNMVSKHYVRFTGNLSDVMPKYD